MSNTRSSKPAGSPSRKKPASRGGTKKKATAAKAEVSPPKDRTIKYRDMELDLPSSLPETILFDITEMEIGFSSDDPRPIFRLLRTLLGPQQFTAIRNKIEVDELSVGEEVVTVMQEALAEYGLTAGESSASVES